MAHALLLLCGAAMVAATSYGDYSGVRLPQYGGVNDYESPRESQQALEQYHPHLPDASASQDYKFENESPTKFKTFGNDFDDADEWQRPVRKHKVRKRPLETVNSDASSQYERDSELTSLRASRRHTKHRSRLKNGEIIDNKERLSRTPSTYDRDKKEDFNDNIYIDKDEFSVDKSKDFEDDTKLNKKYKIRRTIRRKPRDRLLKTNNIDIDEIRHKKNTLGNYEMENIDLDNHLKDSLINQVYSQMGRNNTQVLRKSKIMTELDNLGPNIIEKYMPEQDNTGPDTTYPISKREKSDNSPNRELGRDFPEIGFPKLVENMADPADAVDIRELGRNAPVHDNIPSHHEAVASLLQKPNLDDEEDEEEHAKKKSKPYDDYENYYDMKRLQKHKTKQPQLSRKTIVWTSGADTYTLWSIRRTDVPDYDEAETSDVKKSSQDNISMSTATTPLSNSTSRKFIYNINRHKIEHGDNDDDDKHGIVESPLDNTPLLPIIIKTTVQGFDKNMMPENPQAANSSELLVTKQSILSILQKAHRKEMLPPKGTSKPPVLLQVTKHIPTVVMVEPPGPGIQVRADEMAADTPERIEKVKRLFRHKLLVGAKNIRDLTDNWDSVVCDYVDISMLDNDANIPALPNIVMYFLALYLFNML